MGKRQCASVKAPRAQDRDARNDEIPKLDSILADLRRELKAL